MHHNNYLLGVGAIIVLVLSFGSSTCNIHNCRENYTYNFLHEGPEIKSVQEDSQDAVLNVPIEEDDMMDLVTEEESIAGLQSEDTDTDFEVEDTILKLPEGDYPNSSECSTVDMEKLVDLALAEVIGGLKRDKAKNGATHKQYKVTGRFMPAELKRFKDEVVIIDRAKDGKSGQGADMCQEEFLKKALNKTATGKMNSFPVFRYCYSCK